MSKVIKAGTKTIAGIRVSAGGVVRTIRAGDVRQGGVMRQFFATPAPSPAPGPAPTPAPPPSGGPPFTLSISPPAYYSSPNSSDSFNDGAQFYAQTNGYPVGAVTFVWGLVARSGDMVFSSGVTTNRLNLSCSWPANSTHTFADVWACTATDSAGNQVVASCSYNVNVTP